MIEVVTAVIKNNEKILLLKRGYKVRTYKGKWACISGYLEKNEKPLERAIKEIEEETGLKSKEIKFKKSIPPIEFYDKEEKIKWKVYPFLFETANNKIKIDWEHVEYKWVEINEIEKYDTVPKLKEVIYKLMK